MGTMTFDPQADPLLRPDEVAALLGVGRDTVRRWIRQRQLPAIRFGGRYRVRTSDLRTLSRQANHRRFRQDVTI